MVTFDTGVQHTLWDIADLQADLQDLFHRPVDVITSSTIRNPYRRRTIARDLITIYAA